MDLDWLWQGLSTELLGQVLWRAGAAAIGALMVGYLSVRGSRWAAPIAYALGSFAAIMVILFVFPGSVTLSKQRPQTTPDTVETNIRTWLDTFRMTVKREPDPESHFALLVTLPNSIQVVVTRTKELDRYVLLQTMLVLSSQQQTIVEQLSKEQESRIRSELILELARLNIQWELSPEPLKHIRLVRLVPITSSLTEAVLLDHLHAMGNAFIVAQRRLALALPASL